MDIVDPDPTDDDDPYSPDVDTPLAKGTGSPTKLDGQVVFGETDLGMLATVTFADDESESTDERGDFQITLPQGKNEFLIKTLLGTVRGTLDHDGKNVKQLKFPVFEEFSKAYFNQMLARTIYNNEKTGMQEGPFTVRWPRGTAIDVWIDENAVTSDAVNVAWDAFEEWGEILANTITFSERGTKPDLEDKELKNVIAVSYVPQEEVARRASQPGPDAIGLCDLRYNPDTGTIVRAEVVISIDNRHKRGLLRHEIGHCIGLDHSEFEEDVMYKSLASNNPDKDISPQEKRMAQLLYSLPPRTPAFEGAPNAMMAHSPHKVTYNPDGTVTVTIPTFAAPTD